MTLTNHFKYLNFSAIFLALILISFILLACICSSSFSFYNIRLIFLKYSFLFFNKSYRVSYLIIFIILLYMPSKVSWLDFDVKLGLSIFSEIIF